MRHIVVFLDEGNIVGSFFLDNLPFDLLSIFQWHVSPRFVLALVVLSSKCCGSLGGACVRGGDISP